MSDLSIRLTALEHEHTNKRTQPPVRDYFDEGVFAAERSKLFERGPRYVGHALWVPEPGDFHTLPQEDEGRALVHGEHGVQLVSNVCRHRQALMLRGHGNTREHIVCPIHRWTYDLQGQLVGAPHFATDPCLNLKRQPLYDRHGLLFEQGGRDIGEALAAAAPVQCPPGGSDFSGLDFGGHVLDKVEMHVCDYNWKTFIEVYLEDYHVAPFHPGLGGFVSCDDLAWRFCEHHSVQHVGVQRTLDRPGSPTYALWHQALLKYRNGDVPSFGAIWLTCYPNIMVEWYPHVMVVSTLHPLGPQKTLNMVEFYYPEEIAAFEREFVEAHQAAYMETCVEDDDIALRMDGGRKVLMQRGDDEFGPYQSPMEDGMQHFHEWLAREMGPR
ncbi:MAG: aromatic ring-hydroxylating dioxygenase subunit alpha [Rubrivivax sp.]